MFGIYSDGAFCYKIFKHPSRPVIKYKGVYALLLDDKNTNFLMVALPHPLLYLEEDLYDMY